MESEIPIAEIWSLRLNASDLYNIERLLSDNPEGGGGHTYIQIPRGQVKPLLTFLRSKPPPNGVPLFLEVQNRVKPGSAAETLEFWAKSAGRMRIARQNRHRHSRLTAWRPEMDFPALQPGQDTEDARELLQKMGGVHIYLARGVDGTVWAGFTDGAPTEEQRKKPFADILWGNSPGGYWRYKDETK